MLKRKKKNKSIGGVLGALAVGVGVAAAAVLSDKKTRAKVVKAVSDASKKVKKEAENAKKKVTATLKEEQKATSKVVKKATVVKKAAPKK